MCMYLGVFPLNEPNTSVSMYMDIDTEYRRSALCVCVHARACVCMCVCDWACACASLNKRWRCTLKQSMQLVHVPLSSWHNAVLGTQLVKVCYYSTTHSSAPPSQGSHVSPVLDRLPAQPLQVCLTGLEQDGPPTANSSSQPPQSTLLLLGGV